jgi:glycosyltransferase involved in cell wall biosynthesis
MTKRALIVLNNFAGGGAERSMAKYIVELSRGGYDVVAITLDDRADFALPQGFKWLHLSPRGAGIPFLRYGIQARKLCKLIDSEGGSTAFDIKISTLVDADKVVSRLKDDSFLFRLANDYYARALRKKYPRFIQSIRLMALKKRYENGKIICVSSELEYGTRSFMNRNDEFIRTIYNPFDFDRIRTLSKRPDPDTPAEPYVIHVGRPVQQKRHDLLIQAYKKSGIPHRLVLLGSTTERIRDMARMARIEDRVTFIEFKENPYPLIANADALILSSDREGLPSVVIEALICGTPVVSTRCRYGPSEILTGPQARFLVEPGDAEALSSAIRAILADPPDLTQVDLDKFHANRFVPALEDFAAMKLHNA